MVIERKEIDDCQMPGKHGICAAVSGRIELEVAFVVSFLFAKILLEREFMGNKYKNISSMPT
jgi:hypothetical protein